MTESPAWHCNTVRSKMFNPNIFYLPVMPAQIYGRHILPKFRFTFMKNVNIHNSLLRIPQCLVDFLRTSGLFLWFCAWYLHQGIIEDLYDSLKDWSRQCLHFHSVQIYVNIVESTITMTGKTRHIVPSLSFGLAKNLKLGWATLGL